MNLRKVFNGSQVGDAQGGGFRRCWGEWNDHTEGESYPMSTYQAGYGSRNQLWETSWAPGIPWAISPSPKRGSCPSSAAAVIQAPTL